MGKSIYRYFSVTLATNEVRTVDGYGRFLILLSNSSSTKPKVSIGGDPFETLPKGISIDLSDGESFFNELRFQNTSAGSMTLTFAFSAGRIADSSVIISGELNVDPSTDVIETPAKLTATNVAGAITIAADTAQREIILNNQSVNTIWYGDANVDGAVGRGIELPAKQRVVVATSALLAFHAPAGNSDFSYMRLKK